MEQYLSVTGKEILEVLKDFSNSVEGLEIQTGTSITIFQKEDGKRLNINLNDMDEVLVRKDQDQKVFLQINLTRGKKVLLTNRWVGFKPLLEEEMLEKVPNVVTTPDLISVFEALEESKRLSLLDESTTLRKVYMAIIKGGEVIGFNMTEEREWLKRLGVSTSMSA